MHAMYFGLGAAVGLGIGVLLLLFICRRVAKRILHPVYKRKPLGLIPAHVHLPSEDIFFRTQDGVRLSGWFVPAQNPSDKTIILMHGWGMNRSSILKNTYFLQRDFNLCYFDFRAMGTSGGTTSSIGYLETRDAQACIDYLKNTRPQQCRALGLYGLSMGGMVALYAAAHNPDVVCVAAEAAYYSYRRVISRWAWVHHKMPYLPLVPIVLHYIRRYLKANPEHYSPRFNMPKISPRPVLVIHGADDQIVPPSQARRLYQSARKPKELWIVPHAAHGKCAEVGGAEYQKRLGNFFRRYL